MIISIFNIIGSKLAINNEDGNKLYSAIENDNNSSITLSFENIQRISTLFLNESIGRYIKLHPQNVDRLEFINIPNDKSIFNIKIKDTIENALLGDSYDNMVNNALTAN